jgi:hypothetical protein
VLHPGVHDHLVVLQLTANCLLFFSYFLDQVFLSHHFSTGSTLRCISGGSPGALAIVGLLPSSGATFLLSILEYRLKTFLAAIGIEGLTIELIVLYQAVGAHIDMVLATWQLVRLPNPHA